MNFCQFKQQTNKFYNENTFKQALEYQKLLKSELIKEEQEKKLNYRGKKDPKRLLGLKVDELLDKNLNGILGRMMDNKVFQYQQ